MSISWIIEIDLSGKTIGKCALCINHIAAGMHDLELYTPKKSDCHLTLLYCAYSMITPVSLAHAKRPKAH
jgi:hypothetical protein